ncbi:MAG TPA: phytoene/squalene synthase family protein, partial [Longimicrobiales bacterium]
VAALVEPPPAARPSIAADAPSAWKTSPESAARGVVLPDVGDWERYLAEHARSFHFAARLFPAERRRAVAGVYAWCRYTDELVDGSPLPRAELEARLDAWLALSRRAYAGERAGHDLADRVMGQMREAGVPFRYAEDLIDGMRMDVRGEVYETLPDLFRYTYRVASVVGLWLCELFGIRDPWMLERAAALGHGMQLTNIARDVGEDLRRGGVYLPAAWLAAHDLTRGELERMAEAGTVDERYRALVTRLLEAADEQYRLAAPAIAHLPGFFRRPVAVAAAVYRGIHDTIRANGYDTLSRRAYTTLPQKLRLGTGGLWRARPVRGRAWAYVRVAAAVGLVLMALLAGSALLGQASEPITPVSVRPAGEDPALAELARLWVRAVDHEPAVGAGLAAIDTLRARRAPTPSSHLELLLRAYEGSFLALRAKHGGWPPARLRALRDGFALMDSAVAQAPNAADLRYIRLQSGFYLPGIFGRKAEVKEDMSALIRLLPDNASAFPAAALPAVVGFLLEKGSPSTEERQALEGLLR